MPFIFSNKKERIELCELETDFFFLKKYYIYRHIRLDTNKPFYIGVGTVDGRDLYKRAFSYSISAKRSLKWYNIFNKTDVSVDIIFQSNNREEIFLKEIEFISLYKRESEGGSLVNNSLGGRGTGGAILNLTTERRIRMAARCHAQRGELHPSAKLKESDVLKAICLINKGYKHDFISKEVLGLSKYMLFRIRKGLAWKHLFHLIEKNKPPSRADNIISGLDSVQAQLIVDLYLSGVSKKAMVKELGVDVCIISEILSRMGIKLWTKKERISILGQKTKNQYSIN